MLRKTPKWTEIPAIKTSESCSFVTFKKLNWYVLSKWNKQINTWLQEEGEESASDETRVGNWDQIIDERTLKKTEKRDTHWVMQTAEIRTGKSGVH